MNRILVLDDSKTGNVARMRCLMKFRLAGAWMAAQLRHAFPSIHVRARQPRAGLPL